MRDSPYRTLEILTALSQVPKDGHASVKTPNGQSASVQRSITDYISQTDDKSRDESRTTKSVRLPPQSIITDSAQDEIRRRDRKEDDSLHPNAADLASSPSSTVGAHSTFTPKGQNHSPDTSPDIESRAGRSGDGHSASSDDASFRDAPEVLLKGQPGDSASQPPETELQPEEQLRREEEEAAKARERQAPPKDAELTQGAEQILEQTKQATQDENMTSTQEAATPTVPASSNQGDSFTAPHKSSHTSTDIHMPDADATPRREPGTTDTPQTKPTLERISTRVSTGAIRHKSVSEILGEPSRVRRGSIEDAGGRSSPLKTPVTPGRKDSSRPSTAVALKNDVARSPRSIQNISDDYAALRGADSDETKDYLTPLFIYQASQPPRTQHTLSELMAKASKTLSTYSFQAVTREVQDYRILKRIYQLQNANRWSFRQMEPCAEPAIPMTHLDYLLAEMKWLRTDFREERKLKAVVARQLAVWCAEWVDSDAEQRKALQVMTKSTVRLSDESIVMSDDLDQPPELVPSGPNETDSESSLEELPIPPATIAPSALFSLGFDDFQFELDTSSLTEPVIQELPKYKPKLRGSQPNNRGTLPVSKLLSGKLVYNAQGPPRKRSRYEYEEEDSGSSFESSKNHREPDGPYSLTPTRRSPRLEIPPDENDLALFLPENKHVRDRIHAGHAFRPPSEFGMPSTSFFESRTSSQWLWDEDQELRRLVKEYSYNWSLISSRLSKMSIYTSSAERRTPWECFERWVQLEGLPPEMGKTQYFRTYQARLEAAARTVTQAYAAQQQLAASTPNQAILGQIRKKTTQPFRVEKRRAQKHVMMLDAFRKNARKRETALHKQQESKPLLFIFTLIRR